MPFYRNLAGRGMFSLLEIGVVLVVLGVIGSIVGPRMSRAAAGAAQSTSDRDAQILVGRLRALRTAIAAYADDHGGRYPTGDPTTIARQLTEWSDSAGNVGIPHNVRYHNGPYL